MILRFAVGVLCVLMAGCAGSNPRLSSEVPSVLNISAAWASKKPLVWRDASGCHMVIERADGAQRSVAVSEEDCAWSETWMRAQAAVPKPPTQ